MQKKLIALALASLAGSAFAQTNVTIYGVADGTFDVVRASSATAGSASDFKSRNRVNSNSSYIGFKGVEDLGNGLKAVFQIENGIDTSNGAAGAWNNRDTFVGLTGGFGTVVAGNLTGPARAMGGKMDVNTGATGIGSNNAMLGKLGGGAGASAFDQRINNALAYVSPNFSGFSGVLAYSSGFTTTGLAGRENSGVAGAADKAHGNVAWTGGLNYENGPIYVGYAYTQFSASDNGAAGAADGIALGVKKVSDNRLAVKYTASAWSVGLMFDQPKATPTTGSSSRQNVYYLSGSFNPTANGKIIAQWGHSNNVTHFAVDKTGADHFELGYEYSLSKRTVVKALYSGIRNRDNATYDYLYAVSNSNSTATTAGMSAGTNVNGISIGVRHAF